MAFCSNCGAKIDDGVRFCTGCGSVVDGAQTAQPVQMNSAGNAGTTVSCQGCLLIKGLNCTHYDCAVSEAEKLECAMRGAVELQKKEQTKRGFIYLAELVVYFLVGWFIVGAVAEQFGINSWSAWIVVVAICFGLEALIKKSIKKNKRENARRLS